MIRGTMWVAPRTTTIKLILVHPEIKQRNDI